MKNPMPAEALGPPVRLETKNYIVRTLTAQDASDNWLRWSRDPDIMKPINTPVIEMNREQLQNYIRTFDRRSRYVFGIFDKATDEHVGFYQLKVSPLQRTVTFNVLIGQKSHWGRNAVLETREALLEFFFEQRGIEKAIGMPLVRNFPMIYNYKAQGWRLEGVLRGHCRSASEEKRLDQYQFGLLRSEWHARAKRDSLT
jgi:[ribosomal protein S5]-alanine N-acetyltransferase